MDSTIKQTKKQYFVEVGINQMLKITRTKNKQHVACDVLIIWGILNWITDEGLRQSTQSKEQWEFRGKAHIFRANFVISRKNIATFNTIESWQNWANIQKKTSMPIQLCAVFYKNAITVKYCYKVAELICLNRLKKYLQNSRQPLKLR